LTTTIYASFLDATDAERATGALMDHGITLSNITLIANERYWNEHDQESKSIQDHAAGITTTTAADAGIGAVKGASVGLGVGVLAALAAVFIPGVGLVIGGGALATALAGTAAAIGGGVIAGGVYGFLKDQGVPEDQALAYRETFDSGGVILAVTMDESIDRDEIDAVLAKYNAVNVNRYGAVSLR